MKRKNIVLVSLLILFGFLIQSCSKDDTTFTTRETATIPVSVSPAVSSHGTVLCPGPDSTATLGWTYNDLSSATHTWTVYFGEAKKPPVVATGVTATSYVVKVKEAKTYYWKVETVDAKGIVSTSPTYHFIAVIGTNDKMFVNLICETDVKKQMGLDYTADQTVDLRLYFLKKSDLTLAFPVVDAAKANEVYRYVGDLADGDYYIAVNCKSTLNAGSLKKVLNLNLYLQFTQLGLNYTYLEFPSVITDGNNCIGFKAILCEFNKTGAVYTINKNVKYSYNNGTSNLDVPAILVGTWKGWDADATYLSQIVSTTGNYKSPYFTGIGIDWMTNDWVEEVRNQYPFQMAFDYCAGTISIPSQNVMETKYWSAADNDSIFTNYTISGTGTFNVNGTYPTITLHYDFTSAAAGTVARYFGLPYFTATLTLDPAGLPKSAILPVKLQRILKK